tara:strand:+ start:94 stop:519 length:426 start_codon:yes stop_codon:yes gene_type:complete
MTIFERVKNDRFDAMKAHDLFATTTLTTLLGEMENNIRRGKNTEADAIKLIQSFVSGAEERKHFTLARGVVSADDFDREIAIYKQYLPEMVTDEEMIRFIDKLINENPDIDLKGFMVALNGNFRAGTFDRGSARKLFEGKK